MSCYRWEFSINPEPFYSFNISLAYAYNFILCVDILCILFSKNDIPWRNQHFYSQKFSWKVQWWKKIYSCSIWADLKCGSQDFLSIISVCHHNEKYQTKAESLGVARSHSLQSIYVRKCEGNFCKTNLNLKFCEKKTSPTWNWAYPFVWQGHLDCSLASQNSFIISTNKLVLPILHAHWPLNQLIDWYSALIESFDWSKITMKFQWYIVHVKPPISFRSNWRIWTVAYWWIEVSTDEVVPLLVR